MSIIVHTSHISMFWFAWCCPEVVLIFLWKDIITFFPIILHSTYKPWMQNVQVVCCLLCVTGCCVPLLCFGTLILIRDICVRAMGYGMANKKKETNAANILSLQQIPLLCLTVLWSYFPPLTHLYIQVRCKRIKFFSSCGTPVNRMLRLFYLL